MAWKTRAAAIASTLVSLIPVSAAAEICWIRSVEKHPDGIRVSFNGNTAMSAFVQAPGSDESVTFQIVGGVVADKNTNQDHLLLRDGSSVYLRQSNHDSCRLLVYDTQARSGLEASATGTPHGMPHAHLSKFIPASQP